MVKTSNKLKSPNNPKNKISQRHISNSKRPTSKNVSNNRRFNNKSKFSGKSHLNKANLRNMKAMKKERFLQKKEAKTKLSIKQEEDINNMQNERELFDEDGFYKIEEEVNEKEWEENDLLAGKTITLGDSLFNKMTNV